MEVSFTSPEPMWTLTMKLPYTKWNFTPKWNLKPVWGHLGFYVNVLLLFTWKTHCGLKFHFGQFDRSEIWTKVSFTLPEVIWKLIMKLPYTEVKFYPKVKSQTSLSSLRVSCKRALIKPSCRAKQMNCFYMKRNTAPEWANQYLFQLQKLSKCQELLIHCIF